MSNVSITFIFFTKKVIGKTF